MIFWTFRALFFLPVLFDSQVADSGKKPLVDFQYKRPSWLSPLPAIDQKIQKIIQKQKRDITQEAAEFFKKQPLSVLLPFKLHIRELKLFEPKNKNIISVRMQIYTYTGGAHGGTQSYSFNWHKKKKTFLSLSDFFSKPAQFDELVQKTRDILFEKQKQGDSYDKFRWSHIKRGTEKKEDFKIWNLHKNNLVVVFPPYQVASFAAGRFEVFIPLGTKKGDCGAGQVP